MPGIDWVILGLYFVFVMGIGIALKGSMKTSSAIITRDHCGQFGTFFEFPFLVEKIMGIDIRLPIGILFSLLGLILVAYGTLADTSRYEQSLGMNINLIWGAVLLAFGLTMLLLGRRGMRVAPQKSNSRSSDSSGHSI